MSKIVAGADGGDAAKAVVRLSRAMGGRVPKAPKPPARSSVVWPTEEIDFAQNPPVPQASAPPTPTCLTCGYLLHGLPDAVCPECGRPFDPADPTTFNPDPMKNRRSRRINRLAVAVAMLLLIVGFAPRGLLRGDMSFVCQTCGMKSEAHRLEAKPPRWLPLRYPGVAWREQPPRAASAAAAPCSAHLFDVSVRFDMHNTGRATSTLNGVADGAFTWNGRAVSVATAKQVLRTLMEPGNNGIGP